MNTLLALACLTSLGFCVEELPDLLRRKRLDREQLERERSEASLALAIDAKWREFGCARGLARARRFTTAKYPPPVGPSPILMKTAAEASAALTEFGRRVGAPARPWIVNPRTLRPPRGPSAVTPPRQHPAALDTSELQGLIDRRNGGGDLRSGGKRRAGLDTSEWRDLLASANLTEVEQQCYTCGLLNREVAGPHEHPFEDLAEAERAERDRWPRRSKALWELVARARRIEASE